jgi:hypothetical protein
MLRISSSATPDSDYACPDRQLCFPNQWLANENMGYALTTIRPSTTTQPTPPAKTIAALPLQSQYSSTIYGHRLKPSPAFTFIRVIPRLTRFSFYSGA